MKDTGPAVAQIIGGQEQAGAECPRRYDDGGEELYDVLKDPNEWRNLADHPRLLLIVQRSNLKRWNVLTIWPCHSVVPELPLS